ncbi:MAG TPA: GAF domain-containing sensor histidine kinase [Streptosporangiaceae bacterium]|nr:GAF domain-containing sensor histidine kinase [Streptosporangiaceae bacterium]
MRQHLAPGLDPMSPSAAGRRSRRRAGGWVAVLAAVLAFGAAAGVVLAAAGRGSGAVWPYAVQGPVGAVAFGVPAVLVLRREARSVIGWLLGLVGLLLVIAQFATDWAWLALVGRPGSLPGGSAALWVASWLWLPGYYLLPTVLLLLAPDGRLPGDRWKPAAWLGIAAIVLATAWAAVSPYPRGPHAQVIIPGQPAGMANPLAWSAVPGLVRWSVVLLPVAIALSLAGLVVRWRRSAGLERQQLKAVVAGAVVTVILVGAAFAVPQPWYLVMVAAALVPYPAALGVAALRYHLWDVDLVLRRSLVYAVLTVCIVVAYVLAIVTLGGLLGRTTGAPLVATAVVALGAVPLLRRLQSAADRLLYGDRSDPAAAVSRLARRVQATEAGRAPDVLLAEVARDIARGLRLPFVRITTADGRSSACGEQAGDVERLPLVHGGVVVGELTAGAREPGRDLSRRDQATLGEVAGYAAIVVHAMRLTGDLERSRERIVVAREEERRRLRRDLHDGLGPSLAAIALQLETVGDLAGGQGTPAGRLAGTLRDQLRTAIADVRRIVDDLRPAILDDLGLAEALRTRANQFATASGLHVRVDIGPVPPLSAAAEIALLRIAGEALANVSRHARARHCQITLGTSGDLAELTIGDDGTGPPPARTPGRGVGLDSMRERATELGGSFTIEARPAGGTVVRALLPAGLHTPAGNAPPPLAVITDTGPGNT